MSGRDRPDPTWTAIGAVAVVCWSITVWVMLLATASVIGWAIALPLVGIVFVLAS